MDQQRAAGTDIYVTIGGERRRFARLSMRQVGELLAIIPITDEKDRPFLTVYDLTRWAGTLDGSIAVLAMASGEPADEVLEWGSAISRSTTAGIIVAESLLTGEEQPASEGENRRPPANATTPMKPSTSPDTPRGSVIPGRLRRLFGTQPSSASARP